MVHNATPARWCCLHTIPAPLCLLHISRFLLVVSALPTRQPMLTPLALTPLTRWPPAFREPALTPKLFMGCRLGPCLYLDQSPPSTSHSHCPCRLPSPFPPQHHLRRAVWEHPLPDRGCGRHVPAPGRGPWVGRRYGSVRQHSRPAYDERPATCWQRRTSSSGCRADGERRAAGAGGAGAGAGGGQSRRRWR